jgi:hypothetical protein
VCNGNNDVQIWDFRTLEQRQAITVVDSVRFLRFDNSKIVVYAMLMHTSLVVLASRSTPISTLCAGAVGARAISLRFSTSRATR